MEDFKPVVEAWTRAYNKAVTPFFAELIEKYGDQWLQHVEEARKKADAAANEAVKGMLDGQQ